MTATPTPPAEETDGMLPASAGSLASFIGFAATKDFRSARRAMRPVVGDTFITNRDGYLIFSQVDWIDAQQIGLGRFYVEGGTPIGFARMDLADWPKAIMRGLRMGAEFRPANVKHIHR
jgi:hypothetical protein